MRHRNFVSLILAAGLLFSAFPGALADSGPPEERPPQSEVNPVSSDTFSSLRDRVQGLEREVNWMKQEIRFLKDQNQQLDRRVDDLRTRHV